MTKPQPTTDQLWEKLMAWHDDPAVMKQLAGQKYDDLLSAAQRAVFPKTYMLMPEGGRVVWEEEAISPPRANLATLRTWGRLTAKAQKASRKDGSWLVMWWWLVGTAVQADPAHQKPALLILDTWEKMEAQGHHASQIWNAMATVYPPKGICGELSELCLKECDPQRSIVVVSMIEQALPWIKNTLSNSKSTDEHIQDAGFTLRLAHLWLRANPALSNSSHVTTLIDQDPVLGPCAREMTGTNNPIQQMLQQATPRRSRHPASLTLALAVSLWPPDITTPLMVDIMNNTDSHTVIESFFELRDHPVVTPTRRRNHQQAWETWVRNVGHPTAPTPLQPHHLEELLTEAVRRANDGEEDHGVCWVKKVMAMLSPDQHHQTLCAILRKNPASTVADPMLSKMSMSNEQAMMVKEAVITGVTAKQPLLGAVLNRANLLEHTTSLTSAAPKSTKKM